MLHGGHFAREMGADEGHICGDVNRILCVYVCVTF